jgi:hypothetical protein
MFEFISPRGFSHKVRLLQRAGARKHRDPIEHAIQTISTRRHLGSTSALLVFSLQTAAGFPFFGAWEPAQAELFNLAASPCTLCPPAFSSTHTLLPNSIFYSSELRITDV